MNMLAPPDELKRASLCHCALLQDRTNPETAKCPVPFTHKFSNVDKFQGGKNSQEQTIPHDTLSKFCSLTSCTHSRLKGQLSSVEIEHPSKVDSAT